MIQILKGNLNFEHNYKLMVTISVDYFITHEEKVKKPIVTKVLKILYIKGVKIFKICQERKYIQPFLTLINDQENTDIKVITFKRIKYLHIK